MRAAAIAAVVVVYAVRAAAEPLPPPTLVFPADHGVVGHPDPAARAITPFVWKAVPGAVRYRMVLDFAPTFERPLHDQAVSEATQMLTGLEVGRYFWRVATIDADGVQGPFSDPSRFSVERVSASAGPSGIVGGSPALIFDIQARPGRTLSVKGKTEPGARVTLNDQPLPVEPDGTFNEFVTVREVGHQEIVIRSIARDGGVSVKRQGVVIDP